MMEYNKPIADMEIGQDVEGFYVLQDAFVKTSSNGRPFLSAVLADKSGSISAKSWDYTGSLSGADNGRVVKIRGAVSEFKGNLQLTVGRIRLAEERDNVDLSGLVPTAPIDREAAAGQVEALVESMTDADYKAVCKVMLERHGARFRVIPAAKSVHHGFLSGLLMHTWNMLKLADFLAEQYSEVIDRSLLLAGTLLHDIAKDAEFCFSELGLATEYSVPGQLLGHLVMGAREVAQVAEELGIPEEKSILLQHMLLSHHGEPEFGAAVRPQCAEAELLSCIDLVDSRMEIYAENLEGLPAGSFSNRIFALEKKIYKHN